MANVEANNIETVETRFLNNLGNPKLAARDWTIMVNSVVKSRDTTVLTRKMKVVRDVKKDAGALRAMRVTCETIWPGAKFTVEDGKVSLTIKGIKADPEAVARMDKAVADGLSLRDTYIKAVKGDTEEKPYEAKSVEKCEKIAKAAVKKNKEDAQQKLIELERLVTAYKAAINAG